MGSLSTKQMVSLGVITSYSQWFVAFSYLALGQLSKHCAADAHLWVRSFEKSLHLWETKMGMTPLAKKSFWKLPHPS